MSSETLIIVVGGDYLALEICKEILKTAGHGVVLTWKHADERAARLLRHETQLLADEFGQTFTFVNEDPTEPGALRRAGLHPPTDAPEQRNYCVVAVSQDDRLNLRVALLARDINDRVRVTLRQFNPMLGHKIQEGLRYNCTAISPAAHAAATYAASAVDPSCFYALPFPTLESMVARVAARRELGVDPGTFKEEGAELFGFSERRAADFGIAGKSVSQAEAEMRLRIVSVNGTAPYLCHGDEDHADRDLIGLPLHENDRVVAFGPLRTLKSLGNQSDAARSMRRERMRAQWSDLVAGIRRIEPVLRTVFLASLTFYVAFVVYFAIAMHWNVAATMYFVLTTMTTVGFGDVSPCKDCAIGPLAAPQIAALLVTMVVMVVGVTTVAVFTASLTSALNAAAVRRIRGLRRIHRSNHVIVCGAGNVGSLVIDYLRQLGEQVVVVERNPDNLLVELARDRKIDLLTGDSTNDETITYCSPERAKSLIGVTNSDTANLETALGAKSRVRDRVDGALHIVLRIDDLAFGRSIKRHFGIASFSTTELTAPTIAGLARFESTRGRFAIFTGTQFEQTFQLAERFQGPENLPPPAPPERPGYKVRWIPLYAWRESGAGKGVAVPIHKFAGEVASGDRILFMVSLDQFGA
jgi:Trk K+ transport system NAD-binding subunit